MGWRQIAELGRAWWSKKVSKGGLSGILTIKNKALIFSYRVEYYQTLIVLGRFSGDK